MKVAELLAEIDEKAALEAVKRKLEDGVDALTIIDELREGMEIVGEKFEKKEYCIADLFLAGEIFKSAMEILKPFLPKESQGKLNGKVVIGTARGDIHDIGKTLVITLLRNAGFEVIDLGADVPPKLFVKAAKKHRPNILAISGLLITSADFMRETIEALETSGARGEVKVMLGGRVVKEKFSELQKAGADQLSTDAMEAVKLAANIVKKSN